MRPITKFFLLLVAAFVVYLVWPRTADLKGFEPDALAKLTVADWTAQRDKQGFPGVTARFKIYTSQYHFSPIASYRMAKLQETALTDIVRMEADKSDGAAESGALSALTEKYAMMKREAKEQTEPDSLSREEIAWETLKLENAPESQIAEPVTKILAARYGGLPGDYVDVAANLVRAQHMVFAKQDRDDESGFAAVDFAREGYKLLKELANTPPTAPAAQP